MSLTLMMGEYGNIEKVEIDEYDNGSRIFYH